MSTELDTVDVHLIGIPVETWKMASAHRDALQREFDILMADLPRGSIPHQLAELVEDLSERFHGVRDASRPALLAAAEQGVPSIDLVLSVPPEIGQAVRELSELMDAADEFCREGERLLTMASPPELVRFRRWFLGEFSRQVDDGADPTPWDVFEEGSGDLDLAPDFNPGVTTEKTYRIQFKDDLDLATSGRLRDEIIAARKRGSSILAIDLTEVGFMDSVGLSLLVSTYQRVKDDGTEMRISLPAHLRRLFEISGLIDVLDPEFVGSEGPNEQKAGS